MCRGHLVNAVPKVHCQPPKEEDRKWSRVILLRPIRSLSACASLSFCVTVKVARIHPNWKTWGSSLAARLARVERGSYALVDGTAEITPKTDRARARNFDCKPSRKLTLKALSKSSAEEFKRKFSISKDQFEALHKKQPNGCPVNLAKLACTLHRKEAAECGKLSTKQVVAMRRDGHPSNLKQFEDFAETEMNM